MVDLVEIAVTNLEKKHEGKTGQDMRTCTQWLNISIWMKGK